jgi:hypothetical protein
MILPYRERPAHDLSPGLMRQRRNLMAASLILIFLTHAGAELGSTSILGVELQFANPRAVYHFVWMFVLYYLFRYYQYYREDPVAGMSDVFYSRLMKVTESRVRAIKAEQHPDVEYNDGWGKDARQMDRVSMFKRRFKGQGNSKSSGERVEVFVEIKVIEFLPDIARSIVWVLVNTSRFTDYHLPFVLALFACVYAVI